MKTSQNKSHKEKYVAIPYMFFGMILFIVFCVWGLVMLNLLVPKQNLGDELIYIYLFLEIYFLAYFH